MSGDLDDIVVSPEEIERLAELDRKLELFWARLKDASQRYGMHKEVIEFTLCRLNVCIDDALQAQWEALEEWDL